MLLLAAALALAAHCAPAEGLNYVCGPRAAEDLVQLPGSQWLVTSGLATDAPGGLWLVDARHKRARRALPLVTAGTPGPWQQDCPGAPRMAGWSFDGLALQRAGSARHYLFAANHGDRHAIEVFTVAVRRGAPRLAWVGCVPLPPATLANAVAPLRDGGLVMASFHDPDDAEAWNHLARGEATSTVWEWHAGSGWRQLDAGPLSGANGLALSDDERTVIVSAWAESRLVVFARDGRTPRREVRLDFLPDNLHRDGDGMLLVAGQRSRVADIAACNGPACPQPWQVARVDWRSGAVTPVAAGPGSARIGYACGALRVGRDVFITARGDDRLAWLRR